MKKTDLYLILFVLAITLPFALNEQIYGYYTWANSSFPYLLAALKFAILASLGEMIGLRIKSGNYTYEGFGLLPRAIYWGFYGAWIAMVMRAYSVGTPIMMEKLGFEGVAAAMSGGITPLKVVGAFGISVIMNTSLAPVFMTLHKITDSHIAAHHGSLRALITPIDMASALQNVNWQVQWSFVFKRTIPLFWFPAHTITFLLPPSMQVLFAALLSIVLGVLLSIAAVLAQKKQH
ncbi:MAG: hypothetical protein SNH88_06665 [Rikenellaceae bacterium]